jgi:hypothetical protein
MTIPVIALCICVIIFLFAVGMLRWLGAPPKRADIKFAWWPHKLSERATDAIWYETDHWAWLERIGVHKTLWGEELYFRLH